MRRLLTLLIGGVTLYAAGTLVIKSSAGPDAQAIHPTLKLAATASMVWSWRSESAGAESGQSERAEVFTKPRDQGPQPSYSNEGDKIRAKVSREAELRTGPSSYAALVQSFDVGTELEVMWRKKDGWVQVTNPATSQRGWMLEQNLIWVSGHDETAQKAAQSTTKAPIEVAEQEAPPVKHKSRRAATQLPPPRSDDQWKAAYGAGEPQRGPVGFFGLF
jgi:uncharacterized protein YgiM (DUF1202 family)